jgi:hypothetical protein
MGCGLIVCLLCVGAGLVELFDTGAVGMAVRGR